jgi:hypothetical protein
MKNSKMTKTQNSFCAVLNGHQIHVDSIYAALEYGVRLRQHKNYFDFWPFYFYLITKSFIILIKS